MSRYDDRYRGSDRRDDRGGGGGYRGGGGRGGDGGPDAGATRLYVGRLSTRTRSRDLEDLFAKYGRVRDVDVKHDFAFIEFADARDADDARHYCNGKDFDGNRLIVEFARRRMMDQGPRGGGGAPGGAREYLGRGPPPGTGRCYNCGNDGHWARDCKAGDWRDKCYRCGQRGHIERNCRNSPRPDSSRSRSRSRSRSPRGHGRSRKSVSRSRSRSYSRSSPRRGRSPGKGGRSPLKGDRSPMKDDRSPVKSDRRKADHSRSRSRTPLAKDEKRSLSPSPVPNGRSMSRSPAGRSVSPEAHRGEQSPAPREKRRSVSPSPEQDMDKDSPIEKDVSPAARAGRSPTPEEE
ncbi:hypothetical protein M758_2G023200 [Ceratodon purpureus]|uniref:Uncharacterized protein n=1 Tax=Ceratodon purpureus TaxID=3225 RepID=A0A8T0IQY9_CERPU|nr:hypothetical protein KC19_2G023700 [Ceratodon purpureus]KAG0625038.1 hypothetical protein M758_2G023200 [Ceratodon purpureus]